MGKGNLTSIMMQQKSKVHATAIIALLTVSFLLAMVPLARAQPTISLSPDFGPVGSKVKVSGTVSVTPSAIYPVKVYWSDNDTLEVSVDKLLATVTAPKTPSGYDYETTVTIPTIPQVTGDATYYVIVWQDINKDGIVDPSEYAYDSFTVKYFSATVSPYYVKAGTYEFSITVKNDVSSSSIYYVEIGYTGSTTGITLLDVTPPAGWFISWTWWPWIGFQAMGGNEITVGTSKVFKVKLSIDSSAVNGPTYWYVDVWNTVGSESWLSNPYLEIFIDTVAPTVTISSPDPSVPYYSAGFGNRIWINGTVSDTVPSSGFLTPAINDTRFTLVSFTAGTGEFAFANITAIPDGKLAVKVTVQDKAGNLGSEAASTVIDSTAPKLVSLIVLDQDDNELPCVGGVYWMGTGTTGIRVNATFDDPSGVTGLIFFNETAYPFINKEKIPSTPFSVSGSNYLTLNITIEDGASPTTHKFTGTWEIKRDKVKPSAPTFTIKPICGGAIISGLTATDNVGILSFEVYINRTTKITVPIKDLQSEKLTGLNYKAFSGTLVLDLTGYAGKVANITIIAVDYGANKGPAVSKLIPVPKGTWVAIELYKGWNLISLPLVPYSTAASDILSLLLKQGAAGVEVYYGFDNQAKSWVMNPATMTDGNGYWLSVKAYDVLIVQGTPHEEYWGLQPIHYSLYKGWNLVGYTETVSMPASKYVESLQDGTYFRYLFVWDAHFQRWTMVDTDGTTPGDLSPGQGFWMLLYEDQTLVPPVP